MVLGYDWLTHHNPIINWMEMKITFWKPATPKLMPTTTTGVDIHWVSARTMTKLHQDPENTTFAISPGMHQYKPDMQMGRETLSARSVKVVLTETFPDTIPREYLKFCKVFSGEKANVLAPHRLYDLKINLEEGTKPFHRLVYSLLPPKLATLRNFLEENTRNGFIQPSKSPWGAPVLFVKKKDGSLQLCMDFCNLNRMSKKDHYPLPLIPDLLNSPGPAQIYTKIDLKNAYHLVHISEGDKLKTV